MKIIIVCLLALCVGCQTQFTGDPHIDPGTCQAKCAAANLQMSGIVYMGEYSSACLCEVPRPPGAVAPPAGGPAAGAAAGAAAGVVMQMRRAQEQQRRQGY